MSITLEKLAPFMPLICVAGAALGLVLWALGLTGLWLPATFATLYLAHPQLATALLTLTKALDTHRSRQ